MKSTHDIREPDSTISENASYMLRRIAEDDDWFLELEDTLLSLEPEQRIQYLSSLGKGLRDPNPAIHQAACQAVRSLADLGWWPDYLRLGSHAAEDLADAMLELPEENLDHELSSFRRGELDTHEIVPALLEGLLSASDSRSRVLHDLLLHIAPEALFLALCSSDEQLKRKIALLLTGSCSADPVSTLLRFSQAEDILVRYTALAVLAHLNNDLNTVVATFAASLSDGFEDSAAAWRSLRVLLPQHELLWNVVYRAFVLHPSETDHVHPEFILEMRQVDHDDEHLIPVLKALLAIDSQHITPAILPAVQMLGEKAKSLSSYVLKLLDSPIASLRLAAIDCIDCMNCREAVPRLLDMLELTPDESDSLLIAETIGRLAAGDAGVLARVESLRWGDDGFLESSGLRWSLNDRSPDDVLSEDVLRNHESELIEAQLRAVSGGIMGVGEAFSYMEESPLLAKGLRNDDPVLRRYAAESLASSNVRPGTVVPDLLRIAADNDADVRVAARRTLRAIDDTGNPRFRALKHVVVPMMVDCRRSPKDIVTALVRSSELISNLRRIAEKRFPGKNATVLIKDFFAEHYLKMLHRNKRLRFDILQQDTFDKWIATSFRNYLTDIQQAYKLNHIARQLSSFSRPPTISADDAPLSHVMAQREMAPLLNRLLQDLPARERQVFRARFFQGLTIREVAEVLSLSKNKVETSLNRGLRQLRSRIKRELPQYAQIVEGGDYFF